REVSQPAHALDAVPGAHRPVVPGQVGRQKTRVTGDDDIVTIEWREPGAGAAGESGRDTDLPHRAPDEVVVEIAGRDRYERERKADRFGHSPSNLDVGV